MLRGLDSLVPVFLLLVDLEQELEPLLLVSRARQLGEHLLRAVEQAGLEIVLRQFVQRRRLLLGCQVIAIQQVLVHPDGALHFATTAKQATQREMQLHRLWIDLDHLDEGFDRLVRLLVEQKLSPLK